MAGPYCAFLRGINVNGRNMRMVELAEVFRGAGMDDVSSVLATGNILFRSRVPAEELRAALCEAVGTHYGYDAGMFIRSVGEIAAIVTNVPFETREGFHVYAFIGDSGASKALLEAFERIEPAPGEAAAVSLGQFYWQVKKGDTLKAGFSKALGLKEYRDRFTSRNINTLSKVLSKLERMC